MHEGRGIQDTMTLSVLHISDLHRDPANPIGNKILLESLERDRDHYTTKEDPQIAPPNFIIVSGDIVQGVKHGTPDAENVLRQQYDEALTFLNDLSSRFVDGDNGRVIIVPGNHDVSDNKFRQSLTTIDIASAKKRALITQLFTRDSPLRWSWDEFALYKIVDWETYHQRIAAFANFYKSFYDGQRSYSTDPSKQIDVFDFPDLGITVVGFCSCHNNDLLNRQAAVHSDCIAEAGNRLRDICLFHEPLSVIKGGLNGSTQHFILNEEMECMQMTRRNGRGFSSAEKTELWDRWQRGESFKAIGRVFGKPSSSIYFQLSPHGGIRPSPRRRSRLALSLWEREEISRGIVARHSIRSMALLLSRSPSTVSREVRRNGGYDQYRAALADDMAWARARRPKRCKLALSSGMWRVVAMKLGLNWSPEQIAGWLKRAHPGAGSYQVSHETIYRSLFVQARGVLKKELLQHLRSKRTIRRSKEARRKGVGRGQITDMVSIRERPASVEDRAVPGHWEGDLLSGSKNSYIATLVERQTRYVMLVKVANKETLTVVSALIRQARKLPTELYKSLTWDRGKELADHRRFSLATDIDVYFCDPQSPWQRGSNENTRA